MNEWCTDTSSFVSNSTPGLTFDTVPLNDLASDRELVCGSYDKFNTGSHLWTWSFPFLSTSQVSCWSNDNLYNPSSRNKQTWRYEGSQEVGNRKLLIGQQVTREKRGILLGNEPKTSLWWSCTQHDSIDILFGKSFSFLSRTWNQRAHRHYHFSTEADNILCFYTNYVLLFFFFTFFFFFTDTRAIGRITNIYCLNWICWRPTDSSTFPEKAFWLWLSLSFYLC